MKLIKSKLANENYVSKIINIESFTAHPNSEVTRLKIAHVDGFNVIVGIDEQPGLFIYFPVNSQINPDILQYLNLYECSEMNRDSTKKGLFNKKGRVKAIKLKGFNSEGFLLPFANFQDYIINTVNIELPVQESGTEFDTVEHNGKEFWVSKKYIVVKEHGQSSKAGTIRRDRHLKRFDKLIDGQFHFHYDTLLLRKNPYVLQPDSLIQISSKWHGTSGISAYVKCNKKLSWKDKLAKKLGVNVVDTEYNYIYASRTVIKNRYINSGVSAGFYGCDVWAEADNIIKPYLVKGMTIYYEIVGFLPSGRYIQKNYDYGCVPPKEDEQYTLNKHFKIYVYRVTLTNEDGVVHEYSTQEVQQWCKNVGLTPVIEYYYGLAKDLYPKEKIDEDWSIWFMNKLADDDRFFMEQMSPDCVNKVPHEGIVIKKENMGSEAWKLKCFKFLNKEQKELDNGESNIEDEQ